MAQANFIKPIQYRFTTLKNRVRNLYAAVPLSAPRTKKKPSSPLNLNESPNKNVFGNLISKIGRL